MITTFERVREFHAKFDLPVADSTQVGAPDLRPDVLLMIEAQDYLDKARDVLRRGSGVAAYRAGFLVEEISELVEAYLKHDVAKIADALADIDYVAAGTAHMHGIPHDAVVAEVHAANMRKERGPTPTRGSALDVRKPPGWRPPDVRGVLVAKSLGIVAE